MNKILLRERLDYATQRVPQLQFEGMQLLAALGRDVPIVAGKQTSRLTWTFEMWIHDAFFPGATLACLSSPTKYPGRVRI